MSDRAPQRAVFAALILAAVSGLSMDLLLRNAGIGINSYLLGLLLFGAVLLIRSRRLVELPRASLRLLGGATVCLASFAWRDSATLHLLAFCTCLVMLGLAVHRAHGGRLAPAYFSEYLVGVVRGWLGTAIGVLPLAHRDLDWSALASDRARRRWTGTARGVILAIPPVIVFASLFASADPVFKGVYQSLLDVNLPIVISHGLIIGLGAWAGGGFGRELFVPSPRNNTLPSLPGSRTGFNEVRIVLGAVLFVFLLFAAIQVNVLFGGRAFVEAHGNLTYADYARSGFFHLVAAAGLVLPLLLLTDAVERRSENEHREFRALASVLLVLLAVVLLSALQRMRIYQVTFGLTELRVYTVAFMIWLALVLAWLGVTVLRGRRERFMPGAATLGLAMVVALHFINPDRLIATVNLNRAAAGLGFDRAYVVTLSADALPEILKRLPEVSPAPRCQLAHRILRSQPDSDQGDWRSWNGSRANARRRVIHDWQRLQAWSSECSVVPTGS